MAHSLFFQTNIDLLICIKIFQINCALVLDLVFLIVGQLYVGIQINNDV
jgi:hypothetical protein